MLKNPYLLAKIGADTTDNEQILPNAPPLFEPQAKMATIFMPNFGGGDFHRFNVILRNLGEKLNCEIQCDSIQSRCENRRFSKHFEQVTNNSIINTNNSDESSDSEPAVRGERQGALLRLHPEVLDREQVGVQGGLRCNLPKNPRRVLVNTKQSKQLKCGPRRPAN